jgi:hypothetical protein
MGAILKPTDFYRPSSRRRPGPSDFRTAGLSGINHRQDERAKALGPGLRRDDGFGYRESLTAAGFASTMQTSMRWLMLVRSNASNTMSLHRSW